MEASTTKVSFKGQVVIPVNVRRAAGLKEGEKVLAIALDNMGNPKEDCRQDL